MQEGDKFHALPIQLSAEKTMAEKIVQIAGNKSKDLRCCFVSDKCEFLVATRRL